MSRVQKVYDFSREHKSILSAYRVKLNATVLEPELSRRKRRTL
jgi:hypothetical protein